MLKKIQNRTVFCSNPIILIIGFLFSIGILGCSNKRERPSPLRSNIAQIGSTTVTLEYSSPGVKGRDIFGIGSGYLVPYKELWRTGANKSSSIAFDKDLKLDSVLIPKGKYSLFTIPDAKTWIIILNKDAEQWGSTYYQDSLDIFRSRIKVTRLQELQERMMLSIEIDSLRFRWEYIQWSIPLSNP